MTGTKAETMGASEADTTITYDECFDLLSNRRRRYILHYLQQNGETATLGGLAEQIAAWENSIDVGEISYDQRKRVYTSLQQVHLPRMDDAGVVEFDEREGNVREGPMAERLDGYLDAVGKQDVPWQYVYFGLALVSVFVNSVSVGVLWPIAALSWVGLSAFVAVSFFVTSVIHLYVTRVESQTSRDTPG